VLKGLLTLARQRCDDLKVYGFRFVNGRRCSVIGTVFPSTESMLLITCPSCATAYRLTAEALGADGREVRCTRCRTVWYAHPDMAEPEPEPLAATVATAPHPQPTPPLPPRQTDDVEPDDWDMAPEPPTAGPEPDLAHVEAAPPLAPEAPPEPPAVTSIETAAVLRSRPWKPRSRPKRDPRSVALSLFVALAAIALVALVVYREHVVRAMPDAARIYELIGMPVNLRGFEFLDLKTTREMQDGVVVLAVEGRIRNVTRATQGVPRLRLVVLDGNDVEIYAWTAQPPQAVLGAGESVAFRSRLASPPAEGRRVLVRFLTRQDLTAAER
jgi:predicted Zn finger-like uncharacterized protein